ncbi:MAG TPA: two-component regulator propeller domain-containing protein, partial [Flavisolibacter sp.]|nr:two-component regulator propeller domain-containing protein [Flavisolibacter sp.]
MKTQLLFLSCFLLSTLLATAQFNNQKFITYTTEDGLTDNYVVKIVTDTKGFVWTATRNGISRFDGLKFTNYTVDKPAGNGLRSSWITDLAIDKRGTLWASTEWGVCYYDVAADKFRYVNKMNDLVVLYKAPLFLQGDVLWVAAESGLKKINTITKALQATALTSLADPQCVAGDGENIWIGTRGHGFYVYTIASNKWQKVQFPALPANAHLMNFYNDASGFWCATSEGLLQIENTKTATLYNQSTASKPVDALTFVTRFAPVTGDSLLLCGSYNQRLAFFNKHKKAFTQVFTGSNTQLHGIPASPLHNAYANDQMLWLGSDKGLTMLNLQQQDYTSYLLKGSGEQYEKAIVKKAVTHPSPNKLWLMMNQPAGVALYNKTTHQVEKFWPCGEMDRKYKSFLPPSQDRFLLVHQKG